MLTICVLRKLALRIVTSKGHTTLVKRVDMHWVEHV